MVLRLAFCFLNAHLIFFYPFYFLFNNNLMSFYSFNILNGNQMSPSLFCSVSSLIHAENNIHFPALFLYYASVMKRVETNDNQVLSIMVKSCCFTELSMKFDSCNLLLIPQNSMTPHSSEKRESIVSV